jgi:hypothetical protein
MANLSAWLHENKLQSYEGLLEEQGYEEQAVLFSLSDHQLDELAATIKMLPGSMALD